MNGLRPRTKLQVVLLIVAGYLISGVGRLVLLLGPGISSSDSDIAQILINTFDVLIVGACAALACSRWRSNRTAPYDLLTGMLAAAVPTVEIPPLRQSIAEAFPAVLAADGFPSVATILVGEAQYAIVTFLIVAGGAIVATRLASAVVELPTEHQDFFLALRTLERRVFRGDLVEADRAQVEAEIAGLDRFREPSTDELIDLTQTRMTVALMESLGDQPPVDPGGAARDQRVRQLSRQLWPDRHW